MRNESLTHADFIKEILPFELEKRSRGKPIQLVSDFDETLCSRYLFSKQWQTHVPHIKTELVKEAKQLINPICIATARASTELVSWVIWNNLSGTPMPLIAENGAVLVWPAAKITEKPKVKILATNEQTEIMNEIQQKLQNGRLSDLRVSTNHEVVLRPGRVATVEVRAQEIQSKKGTPNDYDAITHQLREMFASYLSFIDIVSSGSSLGIQPRGLNKELGIRAALACAEINLADVFLVGIGDNKNDGPLFNLVRQNGGLTIGVRQETEGLVDFVSEGGDESALQILRTINGNS